jgi:hypothetical protein
MHVKVRKCKGLPYRQGLKLVAAAAAAAGEASAFGTERRKICKTYKQCMHLTS